MKKIFVIICSPKQKSSKDEYVQAYIQQAKECGHDVRVLNVYDLEVDYLRFVEEQKDFDYSLTPELKQAQENLVWAEQLVFVYPIWMLAIPPILSTFISKIFAKGVACDYSDMGPKPLMKDKTAVIIQSYSMPFFFMKYFYSDVPMKWWKVVLTSWCGPKIIKRFDLDMIDSVSEKRKQKWLKDIKKFVKSL
jgi:NAD(P)H dehydrogenase (quinone)